ncbi:MAG: T9SS type A sorting domain-containing protein [Fibrobacteres bacterium]|nr:T9SS type A sorting domain-containing protein [Fibrobacterota bacterium]
MKSRFSLLVLLVVTLVFSSGYFSVDNNTVALWRFNEGIGDSVFDVSGNGHHGRFNITPTWSSQTGADGKCVAFDGYTFAKVENKGAFNLSGTFTLEARILIPSYVSSGNSRILGCHQWFENSTGFVWGASGSLFESYNDSGHTVHWASGMSFSSDIWTVVKFHYDSVLQRAYFFKNNILVDSTNKNFGSIKYKPMALFIGGELAGDSVGAAYQFVGIIDEIKISKLNACNGSRLAFTNMPTSSVIRKPQFKWLADSRVSGYRFILSTSKNLSDPLISLPLTTLSYTPVIDLLFGDYYYQLQDVAGVVCPSNVQTITILDSNIVKLIPKLIPVKPETTTVRKPILAWYKIKSSTGYKLQIDTSILFNNPLVSIPLADTFWLPTFNLPYTKIYWRVSNVSYNDTVFSLVDTFCVKPYTSSESVYVPTLPTEYFLQQNLPNPFNPTTTIRFAVPSRTAPSAVNISVYDMKGKVVRKLANGQFNPGFHSVEFNGLSDNNTVLPAGVYFCRMNAGSIYTSSIKMFLMK